jgi:hypothetical protein
MTGERKHPEHGVFPDRPPIFAVDEADAEAAIGIIHGAAEGTSLAGGKKTPEVVKQENETPHPGMMGDGTEEQNLGQRGKPEARIKESDVDAAFDDKP